MYSNAELFALAEKQPKPLFVSNVTLSIPDDPDGCVDLDAEADRLGRLWDVAHMTMIELVNVTGQNLTSFAKNACIPYSTLQHWNRGERECPVYVRFLLAEHFGLI